MEIDYPVLIMKWLNFSILIGLILKFGWKPINQILEDMVNECNLGIDNSLRNKNESLKILSEKEDKIAQIDQEIAHIMSEADTDSDLISQEMETDTKRELENLQEHHKAEINNLIFSMKAEVQKKFASAAVTQSKKEIIEKITDKDLKNFNDNFIQMLKEE